MKGLEILFEDANYLAVNKSRGLVVHKGKNTKDTLVDSLIKKYPEIKEVGEPYTLSTGEIIFRSGIVHRLDKETSGVMLVAKNNRAFEILKKKFKNREVRKEYRAITNGIPKKIRGTVRTVIGRSRIDFRKKTVKNPRGQTKEAITEYAVEAIDKENRFAYVKFFPKTGRTHQLRVHAMMILKTPILGDEKYGPRKKIIDTLALHSYRIVVPLILGGEDLVVVAEIPQEMNDILNSHKFEKTI